MGKLKYQARQALPLEMEKQDPAFHILRELGNRQPERGMGTVKDVPFATVQAAPMKRLSVTSGMVL
jgi:hypothetical protein